MILPRLSLTCKLVPVHLRENIYGLFRRATNVLETPTCCRRVSTAFSTSLQKTFQSVALIFPELWALVDCKLCGNSDRNWAFGQSECSFYKTTNEGTRYIIRKTYTFSLPLLCTRLYYKDKNILCRRPIEPLKDEERDNHLFPVADMCSWRSLPN